MNQPSSHVAPLEVFALKQQKPYVRLWIRLVGYIIFVTGGALLMVSPFMAQAIEIGIGWVFGACCVLLTLGVWWFDRRLFQVGPPHGIKVYDDHLSLARAPHFDRSDILSWSQLQSFQLVTEGAAPRIHIDGGDRLFIYHLPLFEDESAPARLHDLLLERVGSSPDGETQRQRILQRQEEAEAVHRAGVPTVFTMVALFVVVFGIQKSLGTEPLMEVLIMGANSAPLVADGQWWRLITSSYVHVDWMHLLSNVCTTVLVGGSLERLVGATRTLLVFVVPALFAAVGSNLLLDAWFSLGASGGLFGWIGVLAAFHLRAGKALPSELRISRNRWIFILGINSAFPLLVPNVDYAAHAVGFAAGVGCGYLISLNAWSTTEDRRPSLTAKLALVGAAGATLLATVAGIQFATLPEADHWAALMRVGEGRGSPALKNHLAWRTATSADASPKALHAAQKMARDAVKTKPTDSRYLDTLATIEYRLGHAAQAVELERRALQSPSANAFNWTQLARFVPQDRPVVLGSVPVDALDLSIDGMKLRLQHPAQTPLVVFARIEGQKGSLGVVRIGVSADDPDVVELPLPGGLRGVSGHRWLVVDSSTTTAEAELGMAFGRHDPEVDKLP